MRKDKGVIHAVFECEECSLKWENYVTAEILATANHEKTGHIVSGEIGVSVLIR